MASYRKVPTLNGDTNYAQFGSWKSDLQAYLSRNEMQLWSSLDEAKGREDLLLHGCVF